MADDASPLANPTVVARLREIDGVQWVALPSARRFSEGEVTLQSREGGGVVIEARPTPPPGPQTPAEWAAFWARIDAFMAEEPEGEWPEIPRELAEEPDFGE